MPNSDFNPIGQSSNQMYGEKLILIAGLSLKEQQTLSEALQQSKLASIPLLFATESDIDETLKDIFAGNKKRKAFTPSSIDDKAIIMSGLTETELHGFMKSYRSWKLPKVLWATLTETNEQWVLGELIDELVAEAMKMK